jgi:sugar lactone lactonase YvrE
MPNVSRSQSLRARVAFVLVLLAALFATASAVAQSLQTIAGGLIGDGSTPANANLNLATDIVLDASGNLYIADQDHHRVRKVTPAGVVSTYAGTGMSGSTGDGGPAIQAKLNKPDGLAIDSAGNLYIAEKIGNRVRKVTPGGTISTVAGDGSSAIINAPMNLAVAPNGTIYVSESGSHIVKKIVGGVVSPFAGTGVLGYTGDGGAATAAQLSWPGGLIVEPGGSVLIADEGNNQVRRVDTSGNISTFFSVEAPIGFAYNAAGELHVANYCQVYKVSAGGYPSPIIAPTVACSALAVTAVGLNSPSSTTSRRSRSPQMAAFTSTTTSTRACAPSTQVSSPPWSGPARTAKALLRLERASAIRGEWPTTAPATSMCPSACSIASAKSRRGA